MQTNTEDLASFLRFKIGAKVNLTLNIDIQGFLNRKYETYLILKVAFPSSYMYSLQMNKVT